MSAITNLTRHIVDYAGLFPPAKLPLDEVAAGYEEYLGSSFSPMLARLIIPAGRLTELEQQPSFSGSSHHWKISSLVPSVNDESFQTVMQSIDDFNARHEDTGKAIVDTIEIKAGTINLIEKTIAAIPESINAFLELPHHDDPNDLIASVAKGSDNIFAKIRTGGVTNDLIPPAEQVARFIACCAAHDVGFKATAGLHHPVCGNYRLTYDPNPDFGNMFGYLNVFIAAAFAYTGLDQSSLTQILAETDANNFNFKEDSISWNGQTVTSQQIEQLRQSKAISFGSCSFTEPTGELAELGLLPSKV